jgi:hypothetical protein
MNKLNWKNLHDLWSQVPAKRANTKPTAWLETPGSCEKQTPQGSTTHTVHRSRVDPRKESESCGNARFRERK